MKSLAHSFFNKWSLKKLFLHFDVVLFSISLYSSILSGPLGFTENASAYFAIASFSFFILGMPLRRLRINYAFPVKMLMCVAFLWFFWIFADPVNAYGVEKRLYYIIYFVAFFIYFPFLIYNEERLEIFIFSVFSLGLLVALFLSFGGRVTSADRTVVGESNPIWVARSIGWSVLILPFLGMRTYLKIFIAIFMIWSMLLTGSRGPVVALLAVMVFHACASFRGSVKYKYISFSFVAVITLVLLPSVLPEWVTSRFSDLVGDSSDASTSVRFFFIQKSIELMAENPLDGGGLGYFLLQVGVRYPHNQFLEIGVELGALFLMLFILFVFYSSIKFYRFYLFLGRDYQIVALLFFYSLLNSLMSGDILSPKIMYLTSGLLFYRFNALWNRNKIG